MGESITSNIVDSFPCPILKLSETCHEIDGFTLKSYCIAVHFRRVTSIYQPTNAHTISHKILLKHFKTL